MANHKYFYNAVAAALIGIFAAPAFAAVNPAGDGIKGREVGTPIRVKKNGKWVWDICVPASGMKCDFNGQMKVAKSAEEEACRANPDLCDLTKGMKGRLLANLDPNAGLERSPGSDGLVNSGGGGGTEVVCTAQDPDDCTPGQQMGGDPKNGTQHLGSSGRAKKKGQQMGPDFKEFMKGGVEKFAELRLK